MRYFIELIAFVGLLAAAIYFGGTVTLEIGQSQMCFSVAALAIGVACLVLLLELFLAICRGIGKLFQGRPKWQKGLDSLQSAFSNILLKDKVNAGKALSQAKKHLGDIPLVSWLEGQLQLLSHNNHEAKSIFYSMCRTESNTVFGAHSLYQLGLQNHSEEDILNSVDAIISSTAAPDLAAHALAITIKQHDFSRGECYLKHLHKTIRDDSKIALWQAVFLYEKSLLTSDESLAKKAFNLQPDLTMCAMHYANLLRQQNEYRAAKKVLCKSFERNPAQNLFQAYSNCGDSLSIMDRLKLGEKIATYAPDSWIPQYELGKIAFEAEMYPTALQYFETAYERCHYDFIARKILLTSHQLDEAPPIMNESIVVNFVWQCSHCGAVASDWLSVCPRCYGIGTYLLTAQEQTSAFLQIS